jgi:hypothetical protein
MKLAAIGEQAFEVERLVGPLSCGLAVQRETGFIPGFQGVPLRAIHR